MVEHILIIGGGIMGVSTAYYLSQNERFQRGVISVTLAEAHEIAGGASGKAGGFLALDWHGAATASLAALSYALHRELAVVHDGESAYGYRALTSMSCRASASSDSHKPAQNPALVDSELEFRQKPPSHGVLQAGWLTGPRVESVDVVAGEDTTAQVHPELFTKTLWCVAEARGVRFVHGRPRAWNKAASASESRTMTIDTPDGGTQDIPADTVVLTAGPWTGRVVAALLGAALPMSFLPGHSILIRPREPLPAHAVFASIYGAGNTVTSAPEMFVRPDGLVYVAGENTGDALPEGTANVEVDALAIQKLVAVSKVLSRALGDGVVEAKQLCYRPTTAHGSPFVGQLGSENDRVFVAAGHGPWGITLGPGTGKVMSELILDGVATSADISQLSPARVLKAK